MADVARDLINRTFRMIGAVKNKEVPNGDQSLQGLNLLNELLESFSVNGLLLPYVETLRFTMTPGKGIYVIGNTPGVLVDVSFRKLIDLRYAAYYLDGIRYPINEVTQNIYNSDVLQESLSSYPNNVLHQNTPNTSILTFYPKPDKAYVVDIKGKYAFDTLELDDQLNEIPQSYKRFMRYALARELADEYGADLTQRQEMEYQTLKYQIENTTDYDLSVDENVSEPAGAAAVRSGYFI